MDYQKTLDDYDSKKQIELKARKLKLTEFQNKQQKASVDPEIQRQKELEEHQKREEYLDRVYVREYTRDKLLEEQRKKRIQEIKEHSDQTIAIKLKKRELDVQEERALAKTMAML